MDNETQGALEIHCGQDPDNASSTLCHIDSFDLLYLPIFYMGILLVMAMVTALFMLRRRYGV